MPPRLLAVVAAFGKLVPLLSTIPAARPADALRAAQLWMLDQSRRGLDGLPPDLARKAAPPRPASPRLAEIHAWAAYTYQGI